MTFAAKRLLAFAIAVHAFAFAVHASAFAVLASAFAVTAIGFALIAIAFAPIASGVAVTANRFALTASGFAVAAIAFAVIAFVKAMTFSLREVVFDGQASSSLGDSTQSFEHRSGVVAEIVRFWRCEGLFPPKSHDFGYVLTRSYPNWGRRSAPLRAPPPEVAGSP